MSFLTSAPISQLAVELLRRSLVLPATVTRVPAPEYGGPSGGTVTLRVPVPRTAKQQVTPGATIDYADVEEQSVNVQVLHFYDAARVTDEDLTLGIESFGRQVLLPQIASVAEAAEGEIADLMNSLDPDDTIEWAADADADADLATVLAARQALTQNGAPAGKRFLAVAPDIASRLLAIPTISQVDKRGSSTALDEATIGQVFGLKVVESAALTDGTAVAYHQSAFAFGTCPPAPVAGADSTTATEAGISLRHVLAFDPTRLATNSIVSVFAGSAVVDEDPGLSVDIQRAVRIGTADS